MSTYHDLDAFSEGDPELLALFGTMQQLYRRLADLQPDLVLKVEFGQQSTFEEHGELEPMADQLSANPGVARSCFQKQGYWCCAVVEPPDNPIE